MELHRWGLRSKLQFCSQVSFLLPPLTKFLLFIDLFQSLSKASQKTSTFREFKRKPKYIGYHLQGM